jgi:hypothetical protein
MYLYRGAAARRDDPLARQGQKMLQEVAKMHPNVAIGRSLAGSTPEKPVAFEETCRLPGKNAFDDLYPVAFREIRP